MIYKGSRKGRKGYRLTGPRGNIMELAALEGLAREDTEAQKQGGPCLAVDGLMESTFGLREVSSLGGKKDRKEKEANK